MTVHTDGWEAHIADAFMIDAERLVIVRRWPGSDTREVLAGFDENNRPIIDRSHEPLTVVDGLLFPRGVAAAIAERVKPGPAHGEVARLEQALERAEGRVDQIISSLLHV